MKKDGFKGVIVAVVTPFTSDDRVDLNNLQKLIQMLYREGADGILLFGTTGEGPSLSFSEQEQVLSAGLEVSRDMIVMAGTGCAALPDTIRLTRRAFELGADAVVTVPPFYFKKFTTDGIYEYYRRVLDEAVPEDRHLFLYDIPKVTGVPITHDLVERLLAYAEPKLGGIKDSTGDWQHSLDYIQKFPQLRIFVGTDVYLLEGLRHGAAGCITAGANLFASLAADVQRAFLAGGDAEPLQSRLTAARLGLERYLPFPATLKSLLELRFGGPGWEVRPPLVPLTTEQRDDLVSTLQATAGFVLQ